MTAGPGPKKPHARRSAPLQDADRGRAPGREGRGDVREPAVFCAKAVSKEVASRASWATSQIMTPPPTSAASWAFLRMVAAPLN
jgi:hypothetical protein